MLTHIDLDHTDILGAEIKKIAWEKSGIIKKETPVVCAPLSDQAAQVVKQRAAECGASLSVLGETFHYNATEDGFSYQGLQWELGEIKPPLIGPHQLENAAICIATLEHLRRLGFSLKETCVNQGFRHTHWPGRMEWIGDILLDGAHNACGARALAKGLPQNKVFCVIIGLLEPRESKDVLAPLLPYVDHVIVTRPQNPRAVDPNKIAEGLGSALVMNHVSAALEFAENISLPKLVTGSLYLVGEARAILLNEPYDEWPTSDPLP